MCVRQGLYLIVFDLSHWLEEDEDKLDKMAEAGFAFERPKPSMFKLLIDVPLFV